MERNYLICMLIGQYVAKHGQDVRSDALNLYLDECLIKCCFTPLGTEEGDLQLLDELLGETMMYVIGQGINRSQRRGGG